MQSTNLKGLLGILLLGIAQIAAQPSVAICAIVKDDPDIIEWLGYHKDLNISNVLLYDNNSGQRFLASIRKFVHNGFVKYNFIIGTENRQTEAYNLCLNNYGQFYDFIAFIDCDEYIVITDGRKLPEVLLQYQSYGGLAVNWRSFGSSNHKVRPKGGVINNYYRCFTEDNGNNHHVKTIANTKHVSMVYPHSCTYNKGYHSVNSIFAVAEGPFSAPAVFDTIFINHYGIRSKQDYADRLAKGGVDGNNKTWEYFNTVDRQATENCTLLLDRNAAIPKLSPTTS